MLLWDYEMKDDLGLLDELPSGRLLTIAITEIERVAESVLSASSEAREIYSTCMTEFHKKSGEYMPVLDDELNVELLSASESPEWGVGPLLAAVDQCIGEPSMPMSPLFTSEVLSLCYQAVMEYQEIGDITPDTERQCPALLETIRIQKDMIRRARRSGFRSPPMTTSLAPAPHDEIQGDCV